jgi:hypothetical protein
VRCSLVLCSCFCTWKVLLFSVGGICFWLFVLDLVHCA